MGTALKQVRTWLNEEQYKAYVKRAKKMHETEYSMTKKIVLDFLERNREKEKVLFITYFFVIYSMVATAIIFLIF